MQDHSVLYGQHHLVRLQPVCIKYSPGDHQRNGRTTFYIVLQSADDKRMYRLNGDSNRKPNPNVTPRKSRILLKRSTWFALLIITRNACMYNILFTATCTVTQFLPQQLDLLNTCMHCTYTRLYKQGLSILPVIL